MEQGKLRSVYLPDKLDALVEETRKRLGLGRSNFYRVALLHYLQSLSVLSSTVHSQDENKAKNEECPHHIDNGSSHGLCARRDSVLDVCDPRRCGRERG